jgi:hypothetical protein
MILKITLFLLERNYIGRHENVFERRLCRNKKEKVKEVWKNLHIGKFDNYNS